MNFLAHSFLSFTEEQTVGNLIGDFVKNRDRAKLPDGVQQGIALHRAIDAFTDVHPLVHRAKTVFSPLVRLYSGAFTDVVFDYFLANDPGIKSAEEWKIFSENIYRILYRYEDFLPENFRSFLPRMEREDWLYNYRFESGMQHSMRNVLAKAKYLDTSVPVFEVFKENKAFLGECFEGFFPDLQEFCQKMNESF